MAGRFGLTAKQIDSAKPGAKDVKLFDGGGLFLLVTPKGGKYWRYKYRLGGKEKKASLGTYPEVSLAEAREAHGKMRKQVAAGDDPILEERKEKIEKEVVRSAARPFREVAQEWYEAMIPANASHSTTTRYQRAIRNMNAVFGNKPITLVEVADLAIVLKKHQDAGKFATRERDQLAAIKIGGFCVGRGYLKASPFSDVKYAAAFTSPGTVHKRRPAIVEPGAFGKLLRSIDRALDEPEINRLALRLLCLLGIRPVELATAAWTNVRWSERKLIVPPQVSKQRTQRKKSKSEREGKDFEVPLSRQAVADLRRLQTLTGGKSYLFPARSTRKNRFPHIRRATINGILRRMQYAESHCAHGFRSSFSTIMNAERVTIADQKMLRWPDQAALIEVQLDHDDASTKAIYDRGGRWEDRCELMQGWADRIDEMRGTSPKLRLVA